MSETPDSKARKRNYGKYLLIALLIFFLVIIGLVVLSVISAPFQTKLLKTFLNNQNEKMEEKIQICDVSFHPIKGAVVNDLLIKDYKEDTLLYAERFYSGLTDNLFTVFSNQLSLSEVTLENAQLHLHTAKGDSLSNLERFTNNFVDPDAQASPQVSQQYYDRTPMELDLDDILLDRIQLTSYNENTTQSVIGEIATLSVAVDKLDLASQEVVISAIELDQPSLAFSRTGGKRILKGSPPKAGEQPIAQGLDLDDSIPQEWKVSVNTLSLSDGDFKSKKSGNILYTNPHLHIDYNDFDISDVNLDFKNLETNLESTADLSDFKLTGRVAKDNKSYAFKFDEMVMDKEEASIDGVSIKAGSSSLDTDVVMVYDDFKNFGKFADKVFLNLNFKRSNIAFKDIAYFLPRLSNTPLVDKNINKVVNLSGLIKGRVNNFSSKQIDLTIPDEVQFSGAVRIKDVTDVDKAFLSIRTERLTTSMRKLTKIIPGFDPPSNYYKLGEIDYSGSFSGFTYDFVANGTLNSSLGRAILDTRLDLKPGKANARYSGQIDLINFDLKTWTDNSDFGLVTATSSVKNGRGLLIDYLSADLNAELSNFDYKGYSYSNIELVGAFKENQFDGDFSIDDGNIDLNFDGLVNLKDGKITTELSAFADKLDLKTLNLSEEEFIIQGAFDLNLSGTNLEDLQGTAEIGSVSLNYRGKLYHFDTINLTNTVDLEGKRKLDLVSDYVNLNVDGVFNPTNLPYYFTQTLATNHELWWEKLNLKLAEKRTSTIGEDFSYQLTINDSEDFSDLVDIGCVNVKNLIASGYIDSDETRWDIESSIDELSCDSLVFNKVKYSLVYLKGRGKTTLRVADWWQGEKYFPEIILTGDLEGDYIELDVRTSDLMDSIGIIDLNVYGYPEDDEIHVHLESNKMQILGSDWQFSENNLVKLGDKSIEIDDFRFTDGSRQLVLNDLDRKGVKMTLQEFNLDYINGLINYENIYFSGAGDVSVIVNDVFAHDHIWTEVKIPNLYLNEEDYGTVYVNTGTRDFNVFEGLIKIVRDTDNQRIEADFDYDQEDNNFNAYLQSSNVNLSLFEYIIKDGTSGTVGTMDVTATISGSLDDFVLEGLAKLKDGRTKVDYLGAEVFFDDQEIRVTNSMVDLTGVQLTDAEGNIATIDGGLRHTLLKDFVADATLSSDKFVGLNTTKVINPTYYGKAIGDMDVNFSGPFATVVDITVNGMTLPGTVLNIPVESSTDGYEESFITFVEKEELIKSIIDTTKLIDQPLISGTNIEMNITITPEATIYLIFNERLNDKIEANGRGNLQILAKQDGEFNMYGNYEIERGKYLFTAWGFLAKPFTVSRGSTITWSGDPFNADLNIEAVLNNVRAPLYTFIQEYLPPNVNGDPSPQELESKKRTDVDLELNLTGQLYSPQVSFDLSFPNLPSDLRSFVDTKMRTLRQDEAAINDQVAALLIFQSFIPSNNALGSSFFNGNNLAYSGINTLSEFISSQISFQLSSLLQQAIVDNKYLSSIDFELAFANNSAIGSNLQFQQDLLPDEIEVNLRSRLKNDRWGIDIGTSYVRDTGVLILDDYTTNDFTVEYYITKDRRLKLRVYGQNDFDLVAGGTFQREQRYGAGITYRKEFGSFSDVKKEIENGLEEAKGRQNNKVKRRDK